MIAVYGVIYAQSWAFEQAYEDFSRARRELDETLRDLDEQLASSLAEWDGQARRAYDDAQREWRKAAGDMAAQLRRLHQVIAGANRNYAAAEAAGIAMFRSGE
ncbi:MAG: WXG100 family type VII secretion target [Nocardiopsaceae bacterium]|nr:WXG100 family type VII secretion target [Nocardiopsaceae bacterium]